MTSKTDMLAVVGLLVWTALFASAGLWPYDLGWPSRWRIYLWSTPTDALQNFVLFIPFGLLISRLSFGARAILFAGAYCAALSLVVESAQLFIAGRYTSIADLVLNAGGGVFGAVIVRALRAD